MRLARAALAGAVLATGLSGCTTWNPLVAMGIQSVPAHAPTPLGPISATVTPKAAWIAQVGKAGTYRFRPDVEGGRVYAASTEGIVLAVEEESGKQVSRAEVRKALSGGITVAEGKAFVGTIKGEVIALDLTGKPVWTASVAGEVIAPVAIARKVVVVRTADGRIFGLSIDDGRRLWVYQRPSPSLLLRSEAGVLALGGDVLAGYPNGKLVALDANDGKLTWEVTVTQPRGATDLERIADVAGLPFVDGDKVCAAAFQGKVACFEIQSRNALWSRDVSTALSLARDARHVYVVDDTGAVHALDKQTGASVWKQDKLQYRKLTAPSVIDGRVVVGDGFGFLHVLAPGDGSIVGRLTTDNSAILSVVPAAGGAVLQTAKGSVALVRF
jgi:outer membrane protein assembly factor BamB